MDPTPPFIFTGESFAKWNNDIAADLQDPDNIKASLRHKHSFYPSMLLPPTTDPIPVPVIELPPAIDQRSASTEPPNANIASTSD
eukprot:gene25072-10724_t